MNVVNPSDETHLIVIIPRYYPTGNLSLELYNESKSATFDVDATYQILDGEMIISFDFTFIEADKFQLKIYQNDEVVYRGKLFATTQTPQDYQIKQNIYF